MISRVCSLLRMQQPVLDNRGLLFASGTTVPTDGTDGFQTSCIFQHTDGGDNTAFYVNEGSVTSCEFNAVTTGGPADVLTIGAFASLLQGSGIPISSTQTAAARIYSDDAGANIGVSCRGLLSRFLLTVDQSAGSIRAAMGQLKLATGVDVTTGIYTAVQGYVELAGTHSAKTGSTFSCIDASLEIGTALTVDSGGEACGIHVETTGSGTITNNGTCAGVLITKASGAPAWPYGTFMQLAAADVAHGCDDAFTGMFIYTGTYASAASKGITLSATNQRPVTFVSDDGGALLGAGNYRAVLSRVYIAESQTGQVAIRAIRGQLKVASTKNLNIGPNELNAIGGVEGYIEMAGTHTIGANTRVAAVRGLVEVTDNITLTSGGKLVGVYAELSQVTAKTVNGIGTAGVLVDKLDSDHATHQADWVSGIVISSASTTGILIDCSPTTGIHISSQTCQAYKAEYSISTQQGAWVHGMKVELTRSANIQPATGGWFGGQFVLNAGSSGYAALNKGTYVLQAVFKGSDTNPNGTDIHVARFETQSAGKVSDICYITANSGTTIVGSLLYLATHVAPGNAMALLNVQSSQTVGKGLAFQAGSGSTLTSLLYASGDGTFTNFLEVAASGDGGVTLASITGLGANASGTLKVKVGSTTYYVPIYGASQLSGE